MNQDEWNERMKKGSFTEWDMVYSLMRDRYLSIIENRIKRLPESTKKENCSGSLDLLKAVYTYRKFKTPDECIAAIPSLAKQRPAMITLWKHLNSLNEEQRVQLVHDMLEELSTFLSYPEIH